MKGTYRQFKVQVPSRHRSAARDIVKRGRLDFNDNDASQRIMELRAQEQVPSPVYEKDLAKQPTVAEQFCIEVWSGKSNDVERMIVSSLYENGIEMVVTESEDGSHHILVAPSVARQANEIVREIREGDPLN